MSNDRAFWEQDQVWGFVLIAAGLAALLFQPFDKLDTYLRGAPDKALTYTLLAMAAFAVVVALKGSATVKAALVFWWVAP